MLGGQQPYVYSYSSTCLLMSAKPATSKEIVYEVPLDDCVCQVLPGAAAAQGSRGQGAG
jgi:hypothetical protein